MTHTPAERRALTAYAILAYLFLYLPIAVLIVFSFNESPLLTFPLTGPTLKWYRTLLQDDNILRSIRNSFIVAGAVVPITLVLGVPAAFAFDRFSFPGKAALERAILLPLMIPQLITGLAILVVLRQLGVGLSLATVAIGHTVAWMPIVITQVYARLRRFDRQLEEASMDLGANRRQTFRRVTLPNIRTSLIGSALLVYTLSFDEIAVTFFLTGTENTLPMQIWSMLRQGMTPEINAIGTIIVIASTLVILLGARFLHGRANDSAAR